MEGVAVGETRAQPQGAFAQRLAKQTRHPGDLSTVGGAGEVVHHLAAQAGMAHQGGDVDAGGCRLHRLGIGGEARIAEILGLAQQVHGIGHLTREGHRARADAAIAHHHRGHTLRELGQHLGSANHVGIVMRVHIDEAWGQIATVGVDHVVGMGAGQVAHGDDAVAAHSHVGLKGSGTGAVDNLGVANQQVVAHVSLPAAGGYRRRDGRPG